MILISLLFSAGGNALLAVSTTVATMMVARVVSGLGFQIALFRAYFADTAEKKERTGRFGLIGVITNFALFAGPFLGGLVSRMFGRRTAAWLSSALCLLAALIALIWQPDEKKLDEARMQRSESFQLKGKELEQYQKTHKTVDGVKLIKIDLSDATPSKAVDPFPVEEEQVRTACPARRRLSPCRCPGVCACFCTHATDACARGGPSATAQRADLCAPLFSVTARALCQQASRPERRGDDECTSWGPCRYFRKTWKFARWLAQYDLYPLLSLNFFFRFAFAAYKSVFAFFCMGVLHYGSDQVGYLLSAMGLGGMFVQGVLVRIVVSRLGEEKTLFVAMAATAGGFVLLALAQNLTMLVPALTMIAIGYGLCVPCLTTLFSHVPVEQGIMQGIAGAIDRFGQAFGPVVGGSMLHLLGEASLMLWTGVALASISLVSGSIACARPEARLWIESCEETIPASRCLAFGYPISFDATACLSRDSTQVCLAFIGDGWIAWMREFFCYQTSGYQQVSALEAIDEEDEEELSASAEGSPLARPSQGDEHAPTAALASGVAIALSKADAQQAADTTHSPVMAQPAR